MQLDDEIGKLSATVPPVVCKLFRISNFFKPEHWNSLLYNYLIRHTGWRLLEIPKQSSLFFCRDNSYNIYQIYFRKEAIESEEVFAFLKPLVAHVPSEENLDGKTKSRNGNSGRKRKNDDNLSDANLSDEPGPSCNSGSTVKRKYTRRKKMDSVPSENDAD